MAQAAEARNARTAQPQRVLDQRHGAKPVYQRDVEPALGILSLREPAQVLGRGLGEAGGLPRPDPHRGGGVAAPALDLDEHHQPVPAITRSSSPPCPRQRRSSSR